MGEKPPSRPPRPPVPSWPDEPRPRRPAPPPPPRPSTDDSKGRRTVQSHHELPPLPPGGGPAPRPTPPLARLPPLPKPSGGRGSADGRTVALREAETLASMGLRWEGRCREEGERAEPSRRQAGAGSDGRGELRSSTGRPIGSGDASLDSTTDSRSSPLTRGAAKTVAQTVVGQSWDTSRASARGAAGAKGLGRARRRRAGGPPSDLRTRSWAAILQRPASAGQFRLPPTLTHIQHTPPTPSTSLKPSPSMSANSASRSSALPCLPTTVRSSLTGRSLILPRQRPTPTTSVSPSPSRSCWACVPLADLCPRRPSSPSPSRPASSPRISRPPSTAR